MKWKMHDVKNEDTEAGEIRHIGTATEADAPILVSEFRLLDDDGNVLFEGVCEDLLNQDGDSAFEPLDWGESDSGCTVMEFRVAGSKGPWEEL